MQRPTERRPRGQQPLLAKDEGENQKNCEHESKRPKPEGHRPFPLLATRFQKLHRPSSTPLRRGLVNGFSRHLNLADETPESPEHRS